MSMGNNMGSVNISITKDVYDKLKKRKKKDESFSEIIGELVEETKDVNKCFGLLKNAEGFGAFKKAAKNARKGKWRKIDFGVGE